MGSASVDLNLIGEPIVSLMTLYLFVQAANIVYLG